jgi:ribosome biogenesis GTPase
MKDQKLLKGLVIRGSRNLFTVNSGGKEIECRIKGKILKGVEGYYNPLAPGDLVELEGSLILGLEKRRNAFARFNQKGQAPQLLAANVDLVLCVTSPCSPPFRPRFLDRVLLQADVAGIPAALVCNKYDLAEDGADPDVEERLSEFERLGYPVFRLSALTSKGLDEFRLFIVGKFSVLVGQSGVGKSSLIKALIPELEIKTGAINEKFQRGNHTTTQGVLLQMPGSDSSDKARFVDTPGIRRFVPAGIPTGDLILYMREFAPLAGKCSYGLSCSHETEPGCKIMEAVAAGVIHEDRYESFLRIRDELAGKREFPDND